MAKTIRFSFIIPSTDIRLVWPDTVQSYSSTNLIVNMRRMLFDTPFDRPLGMELEIEKNVES